MHRGTSGAAARLTAEPRLEQSACEGSAIVRRTAVIRTYHAFYGGAWQPQPVLPTQTRCEVNNAVSPKHPLKASRIRKGCGQKPDTLIVRRRSCRIGFLPCPLPGDTVEPVSASSLFYLFGLPVFPPKLLPPPFLRKAVCRFPCRHRTGKSPPVMLESAGNCPCTDSPRLLASPETDTAMLAGMFRPAVILPRRKRTGYASPWPAYSATSRSITKRKDVWFKWTTSS